MRFVAIGANWRRSLGYFGDAILFAELKVDNLPLGRGSSYQFLKGFNLGGVGDFGMRSEVLNVHPRQRQEAQAYVQVNAATMLDNVARTITSLMNPLLRSLGHGVLGREFADNADIPRQ